jgi:hypothetical protein
MFDWFIDVQFKRECSCTSACCACCSCKGGVTVKYGYVGGDLEKEKNVDLANHWDGFVHVVQLVPVQVHVVVPVEMHALVLVIQTDPNSVPVVMVTRQVLLKFKGVI